MQRVLLTESNKSLLNQGTPYYFVIESDVSLSGLNLNISGSSVFDFRGGCFTNNTPANEITLNFHHAAVMAPPYCIFEKGIKVAEIGTNLIHAEWFHAASMKTHEFVNRALEAAAREIGSYNSGPGCPVTLEAKEYLLEGKIEFPRISEGYPVQQKLIIPGQLSIDDTMVPDDPKIEDNFVAIEIHEHGVNLQLNRIRYTGSKRAFFGTGIKFTGNSYHSIVNVYNLHKLKYGIAVTPTIPGSLPYPGTDIYYSAVQYLQMNFNRIYAEYCIYVDACSKNSAVFSQWFSESIIRGGQLSGVNGIFFADAAKSNITHGNGLVFDNIGFEGVGDTLEAKGGIPLALRNLDQCVVTNIRMAESLPGISGFWDPEATWIELKNCRRLNISSKTFVHPNHINIQGETYNVVINGPVVSDPGWYIDHYDKLAILPLTDVTNKLTSQMVATSSVQPVNVAETLEFGFPSGSLIPGGVKTVTYRLADILPRNEIYWGEGDKVDLSRVNILPRTLNVRINNGYKMTIDLSGLSRFSPSAVIDLNATIVSGGTLIIMYNRVSENADVDISQSMVNVAQTGVQKGTSFSYTESGLYRLTFNVDWQLVVTKIATY